MISVNKDIILNSSLKKRLVRGYLELKENYTENNALEYKHLYENASLSEILENSELIFKEPYYGYGFYKNVVESKKIPPHKYQVEFEKVSSYLESYQKEMGDAQKELYAGLQSLLESTIETKSNMIKISNYIFDHNLINESVVTDLYDSLYTENIESTESIFESMNECELVLLYGLDCLIETSDPIVYRKIKESVQSNDELIVATNLSRSINTMQRLSQDAFVMETVSSLTNANLSLMLSELMNIDQTEYVEECVTEHCDFYDPVYASPQLSVNRIFDDDFYSEVMESSFEEERISRYMKVKSIYETAFEFAMNDLYLSDHPTKEISNNHLVPTKYSTIQETVDYLGSKVDEIDSYISEFTNKGEATPVIKRSGTDIREGQTKQKKKKSEESSTDDDSDGRPSDSDLDFGDDDESENKKGAPKKPMQKLSDRLQQKGLDADVNMQKTLANGQRKGQVVKNTAKAILKAPQSIINSFKKQIKDWDDMDDNRRKEYIIKPGNRKKVFSSFKLALYYYLPMASAGSGFAGLILKAKLMPVLFIFRHFSKEKNKRIRNELSMELDTEIKVCEEKINDANSNGDQKEKYQLMRIRDKLVAERTRVRANSKYI